MQERREHEHVAELPHALFLVHLVGGIQSGYEVAVFPDVGVNLRLWPLWRQYRSCL